MIHKFEKFSSINESKNDDYINLKTTDLVADFLILNTKLFGNELDLVHIKWMKSKNKLGIMTMERS